MSVSEVLRLGPWTGGLNLASDRSSVADEELVECINVELDIDGSLRSRPPYLVEGNVDGLWVSGGDTVSGASTADFVMANNALDVRFEISPEDWTPTQRQVIVSKDNGSASGQRSWQVMLESSGAVRFGWGESGTSLGLITSAVVPGTVDKQKLAIKITSDLTTFGSQTTTFYWAEDLENPTWIQFHQSGPAATTNETIFDSTAPIRAGTLGAIDSGTEDSFHGVIHKLEIRDVIDGPVIADPDFTTLNPTDSALVDSTGKTWTVFGDAKIDSKILFGGEGVEIIGSAVFSGTGYIFASNDNGIWQSTDGITWELVVANVLSHFTVQYQNKAWFPAGPTSANGGGNWDPSTGWTAVAAIPRAEGGVVHKERFYICPGASASTNGSRLQFSDPADFTVWTPGTNFIDVSPGDGSNLLNCIVYQDNLLLFKGSSTFVLAYDLNPSEAILREINPVVGIDNHRSVLQYENVVYVLFRDLLYEVVNYDFNPTNIKVPFEFDPSVPAGVGSRMLLTSISLLGDRIIVRFWNKTYVYGLRTRTWSEWVSDDPKQFQNHGPLTLMPTTMAQNDIYFGGYSFDGAGYVVSIKDGYDLVRAEENDELIRCEITTKDFDMADPVHWKKLFHWAADVLTGEEVTATALPIVASSDVTWDQMAGKTWDDPTVFSWQFPVSDPASATTIVSADGNWTISKSIKFEKALRFRKINFSIVTYSVGSSTFGPVKIFSFIAFVLNKAAVTAQVT